MLLAGGLLGFAAAQNPPTLDVNDDEIRQSMLRELNWRALENLPLPLDGEQAQRAEMQRREREFVERANRFARSWAQFANDYNQRGAIDVKAARSVSKAFRALETGEGWPKPGAK